MNESHYSRFLAWAKAHNGSFNFMEVEIALGLTREAAVSLVMRAVKERVVVRFDAFTYIAASKARPTD